MSVYINKMSSSPAKFDLFSFLLKTLLCCTPILAYPQADQNLVESNACKSQVCLETASYLVDSMNESVDPCQDFYEYACGGWLSRNSVPDFLPVYGTFHQLALNVANKTSRVLDSWSTNGTGRYSLDLAASIYKQCLQTESLKSPDSESGLRELLREMGGWPIADPDWSEEGYSVPRALAYLTRELGYPLILGFSVDNDYTNATGHIIQLQTPDQESSLSSQLISYLLSKNTTQEEDFWNDLQNRLEEGDRIRNATSAEDDEGDDEAPVRQYKFFVKELACLISENCTDDFRKQKQLDKDIRNMMAIQFTLTLATLLNFKKNNGYQMTKSVHSLFPDVISQATKRDNGQTVDAATMADMFSNPGKYKMKIKDAQKVLGNFSLVEYLNSVMRDSNLTVDDDTQIITVLPTLQSVVEVIQGNSHATRDLANYIGFSVLQKVGEQVSQRYRQLKFDTVKGDYGLKSITPTWMTCVEMINEVMPFAAGRIFADNFLTEDTRDEARSMVHQLKASFQELLLDNTWMDNDTREAAIKKLNEMEEMIGYPDWIKDDKKLDHFYHIEEPLHSDYFGTLRKIMKKSFYWQLRKLDLPVIRGTEWPAGSPAEVNAYYHVNDNTIIFPSGVLNWPVFAQGRSRAVNYGSMGYVIGHEITHGFDDTGRLFDELGTINNWWTNSTSRMFEEMSRCFADQYSGHFDQDTGKQLNGNKTLGEDIADNGGLRMAFKAYRRRSELLGSQEHWKLPGLEHLTQDQLFFLSSANTWCTINRPEVQADDNHSPAKYRVIVPFSNSEDFSAAFGCKPGTPMNPNDKCVLW